MSKMKLIYRTQAVLSPSRAKSLTNVMTNISASIRKIYTIFVQLLVGIVATFEVLALIITDMNSECKIVSKPEISPTLTSNGAI